MDKKYIIDRQGKDLVLYPGLLDAAHQQGLKRISTRVLQFPGPENGYSAVCAAEIETDRGIFSGIGDASPENVSRNIAPHIIRMSETRAKARAFRDALNVGELLADDPSGDTDEAPPTPVRQPVTVTNGAARVNAHTGEIAPPTFRPAPAPRGPGVPTRAALPVNRDLGRPATRPVPPARINDADPVIYGTADERDDAPHPADTEALPPIDVKPDLKVMAGQGATPKQLETIEGLLRRAKRPPPDDLDAMTRAQASDLISELISVVGVERR